ncbi:hypothetical protein B4089_3715 [Bacillus licheniformis]|nr:hypothetical protein B4089_3624 [Bacillus licheniformis]OLF87245.1 hypothetical protein B4089_3715 [Bacillus licheniformis]
MKMISKRLFAVKPGSDLVFQTHDFHPLFTPYFPYFPEKYTFKFPVFWPFFP